MVLEARARPCSKRAPGGFGVWGAILQGAPCQKGPLVVLEARAGSSKRPLAKRAPDGFGGQGAHP